MGKYLNKNSKGENLPAKGKKSALIKDGAKEVDSSNYQENMIAIVNNKHFDAAAYMYNKMEYEYFKSLDGIGEWLVHPKAKELAE